MKFDKSCIKEYSKTDETIIEEVLTQDVYDFQNWSPVRQPKFIVDVGSQIGCFSFMAAQLYPNAEVISYELDGENYNKSIINLEEFKNVKVRNKAVIGRTKPDGIWESNSTYNSKPLFNTGHPSINTNNPYGKPGASKPLTVECINFVEIFDKFNIDYIDYLKIDCEGSEYEIVPFMEENLLLERAVNGFDAPGFPYGQEKLTNTLKNNFTNFKQNGSILLFSKQGEKYANL